MKILKNVQRVPGGLMVIPLFLGVLCNTFIPDFLTMGGYLTATFSNGGTNSIMGVFFVAVGAQIRVKQAPEILKRGFTRLLVKFIAGASIGWAVGSVWGMTGVFGLSTLAIIAAVTNSNGGMFMSLSAIYGDEVDTSAQAIVNINDGPFLTLVAIGASGLADIPLKNLFVSIFPILLGFVLGNLDEDISKFLKPAVTLTIPFFAFCLGAGINLSNLVKGGLPGILLGLISVFWSGCLLTLTEKFVLKQPGWAAWATATTAGNSVGTPAAGALATTMFPPEVIDQATVQCAAAVIVTAILAPTMATWAAKKWGTTPEFNAKKAALKAASQ